MSSFSVTDSRGGVRAISVGGVVSKRDVRGELHGLINADVERVGLDGVLGTAEDPNVRSAGCEVGDHGLGPPEPLSLTDWRTVPEASSTGCRGFLVESVVVVPGVAGGGLCAFEVRKPRGVTVAVMELDELRLTRK